MGKRKLSTEYFLINTTSWEPCDTFECNLLKHDLVSQVKTEVEPLTMMVKEEVEECPEERYSFPIEAFDVQVSLKRLNFNQDNYRRKSGEDSQMSVDLQEQGLTLFKLEQQMRQSNLSQDEDAVHEDRDEDLEASSEESEDEFGEAAEKDNVDVEKENEESGNDYQDKSPELVEGEGDYEQQVDGIPNERENEVVEGCTERGLMVGPREEIYIHEASIHKCSVCSTEFSSRSTLLRHIQQLYGEAKPYYCQNHGVQLQPNCNICSMTLSLRKVILKCDWTQYNGGMGSTVFSDCLSKFIVKNDEMLDLPQYSQLIRQLDKEVVQQEKPSNIQQQEQQQQEQQQEHQEEQHEHQNPLLTVQLKSRHECEVHQKLQQDQKIEEEGKEDEDPSYLLELLNDEGTGNQEEYYLQQQQQQQQPKPQQQPQQQQQQPQQQSQPQQQQPQQQQQQLHLFIQRTFQQQLQLQRVLQRQLKNLNNFQKNSTNLVTDANSLLKKQRLQHHEQEVQEFLLTLFQPQLHHDLKQQDVENAVEDEQQVYSCERCPISYKYYLSLKRHIRALQNPKASDEKLYWCPYCFISLSPRQRCQGHIQKIHKVGELLGSYKGSYKTLGPLAVQQPGYKKKCLSIVKQHVLTHGDHTGVGRQTQMKEKEEQQLDLKPKPVDEVDFAIEQLPFQQEVLHQHSSPQTASLLPEALSCQHTLEQNDTAMVDEGQHSNVTQQPIEVLSDSDEESQIESVTQQGHSQQQNQQGEHQFPLQLSPMDSACNAASPTLLSSLLQSEHLKSGHKSDPHMCKVCSKKFSSFVSLKLHMRIDHGNREHDNPCIIICD